MSFSKNVKEELSKISNLANKDVVKTELVGYLITNNISLKNNKIKYSTESEYNINRFAKLLNNINVNKYNIKLQGKIYSISVGQDLNINGVKINNKEICLTQDFIELCNNDILKKALIRGSFLGGGSINNPEKKYHLEILFNNKENLQYIEQILKEYSINIKEINSSLYLKDGEEISKFLAFIGANHAVLKFEEIRVIRDMRNNVNRLVNCETANLNKTINASLKQIEDIKYIKKMKKFHELPKNMQEIANLRIDNPEISLAELGKMLDNPIGKSGVNYRLKVICDYAEELRRAAENKGE